MSETVRCPDCGHSNPAEREACEACQFPLRAEPAAPPEPVSSGGAPPVSSGAAQPEGPAGVPERPLRPLRPRRPRPASNQALSLWLIFGTICALIVLFIGIRGWRDSNFPSVEGSSQNQQARADSLRRVLEKDSTNVSARAMLGDILYDTSNWSDAIIHYRSAIAHDSSLATTIVDLGVCYYNLGDADQAERLFQLTLRRDPHQPVALFNLGIVYERRKQYREALGYYHRALESDPPTGMHQPLMEAMERVQKQLGVSPPPLPQG